MCTSKLPGTLIQQRWKGVTIKRIDIETSPGTAVSRHTAANLQTRITPGCPGARSEQRPASAAGIGGRLRGAG